MRPTLFNIPWFNIPIRAYGLMLMIGFLGGAWWAAKRASRVKADPDTVINLTFVALLASVVGARIFYVVHYWREHFAGRGLWSAINITAGGLEFYGGFIGALVAGLIYLHIKRVSWRLYFDIMAPSLMFGMAMTRIGCFLNGCCWGGVCPPEIPWGVRFPYASAAYMREWEDRQQTIPANLLFVSDKGLVSYPLPREWIDKAVQEPKSTEGNVSLVMSVARRFRSTPEQMQRLTAEAPNMSLYLHPAQLYSSLDGVFLALLLNAYFYRRKRQGTVFALLLILYPIMRIVEETVRVDNPHDTVFLTVSQFVSVVLLAIGVGMMLYLRRLPLRSPLAVPFVPPWVKAETAPVRAARKQK